MHSGCSHHECDISDAAWANLYGYKRMGGGELAEHDGRWLQGTQSQLASVDSWIDFVRGLPADAPADALMSHSALRTTIVRIFDMRTADLAAAQNPEVEVESDSVFDSIAAYYRRQYAGDGDEVQVRPPPADAQQWPQRTPQIRYIRVNSNCPAPLLPRCCSYANTPLYLLLYGIPSAARGTSTPWALLPCSGSTAASCSIGVHPRQLLL